MQGFREREGLYCLFVSKWRCRGGLSQAEMVVTRQGCGDGRGDTTVKATSPGLGVLGGVTLVI